MISSNPRPVNISRIRPAERNGFVFLPAGGGNIGNSGRNPVIADQTGHLFHQIDRAGQISAAGRRYDFNPVFFFIDHGQAQSAADIDNLF